MKPKPFNWFEFCLAVAFWIIVVSIASIAVSQIVQTIILSGWGRQW